MFESIHTSFQPNTSRFMPEWTAPQYGLVQTSEFLMPHLLPNPPLLALGLSAPMCNLETGFCSAKPACRCETRHGPAAWKHKQMLNPIPLPVAVREGLPLKVRNMTSSLHQTFSSPLVQSYAFAKPGPIAQGSPAPRPSL